MKIPKKAYSCYRPIVVNHQSVSKHRWMAGWLALGERCSAILLTKTITIIICSRFEETKTSITTISWKNINESIISGHKTN